MTTTTGDVLAAVNHLRAVLSDAEASRVWTDEVDRALDLADKLSAWAAHRRHLSASYWLVEKRPHDQNATVGPVVRRDGWIHRSAGTSDPTHTRTYAAQLLAAADEAEQVTQ